MTFRQWIDRVERPAIEWAAAKTLWAKAVWFMRHML